MKIIHTADWHLGNTFHNHSREEEHRHFLNWLFDRICEHRPDALLVTGDIYDSPNPSARAEEMFYDFLVRITTAQPGILVVIIAGNHDSGGRLEAPASLLRHHNVYVCGTVEYTESGEPDFDRFLLPLSLHTSDEAACVCLALPYLRGSDYPAGYTYEKGVAYYLDELVKRHKKSDFRRLPLLLAAHFYAAGAEIAENDKSERLVVGGAEAVNAAVLPRALSYSALGHIHKAQRIPAASPAYYAGSPLPMSFSEISYRRGVMLVKIDKEGRAEAERLEYRPLRSLLSVPREPNESVSPSEAFKAIADLPRRSKGDDPSTYPYLELRIRESQPEPSLLHDLTEALADRAVLLCRCLRRNDEEGRGAKEETLEIETVTPLTLARECFLSRFETEMPQPLIDRFKAAEEEVCQR